jgi:radical SAM superfamily enzyme
LGIQNESQVVKLNVDLNPSIIDEVEQLLKEYKDVFVWMYKNLRSIPPHLTHHRIELDTNIPTSHQAWYQMNLNCVVVVKQDLDKLLVA